MTQAFCHLVLHYSIARLSWKTIKSLRRSRSRLRRRKCDSGNDDDVSTPMTNHESSDYDDDVSPVEYEILQGWTILAFHSLYVSLGIEYFVRFVIPFYFHMKMMVLIVTFVVPSWAGRNGGGDGTSDYGLSPVISYWFDYLIVPGVHKVHDLMDRDPKGWAVRQAVLLPFYFVDYFVLPGVLATDEEKQLVRKLRSEGISSGGDTVESHSTEILPPPVVNSKNGLYLVWGAPKNPPTDQCLDQPAMPDDQLMLTETDDNSQSETESSRKVSCINKSPARKYHKQTVEERRLVADQQDGIGSTRKTPPRGYKSPTLLEKSSPNRTRTRLTSRKTPTALSSCSKSNKSISMSLSPVAKSRLESSAMKLKRFSHEHPTKGSILTPNTHPRRVRAVASPAEAKKKRVTESSSKTSSEEENEKRSSALKPRRRRRERLSLGDHFRELVTGDSNIRVRDHLFDLELPSPPPGRHTPPGNGCSSIKSRTAKNRAAEGREQIGASNVKARRSSGGYTPRGTGGSSKSRTTRNRVAEEQEQMDASNVTARRSSGGHTARGNGGSSIKSHTARNRAVEEREQIGASNVTARRSSGGHTPRGNGSISIKSRTARNRAVEEREQIGASNVTARRSSGGHTPRGNGSISIKSRTARNRAVEEREQIGASNVTARRSSRLAKKKESVRR